MISTWTEILQKYLEPYTAIAVVAAIMSMYVTENVNSYKQVCFKTRHYCKVLSACT